MDLRGRRSLSIKRLAGAVLLMSAFGTMVHAQTASSAKADLTKVYKALDTLTQKRDVNGVMKYYAPNFVATNKAGMRMNAVQVRETMTRVVTMMRNLRSKSQILSCSVKGKMATCKVAQSFTCEFTDPKTNKASRLAISSVSTDEWMKLSSGWRLVSSKSLKETTTVNGKRVGK